MADEQVLIHLNVMRDGGSLTGSASANGGRERRFEGRLGLLSAIDALIPAETGEPAVTGEGER